MRRGQWIAAGSVPLYLVICTCCGQGIGILFLALVLGWLLFESKKLSKCPHCGASSYQPYPGGLFAKWKKMEFCSNCGEEFEKAKEKEPGVFQKGTLQEIQCGSEEYDACLDLRYRVLRVPLGLEWTEAEMEGDRSDRHFALVVGERVVSCLTIHQLDAGRVKLRQMAVNPDSQGTGLGRRLVSEVEDLLRKEGIKRVELHAREEVIGFYLSLGYQKIGARFQEVGIPHFKTCKDLV